MTAAPSAHEVFRSAIILYGMAAAIALLLAFLAYGHYKGYINLFDLPKSDRTNKVEWRLVGEILAFPVAVATVLIAAIRSHPDLWLILGVFVGTYCARSVVGGLAGAKAQLMTGGGFGTSRYGNTNTTYSMQTPVRGRVQAEPGP